MASQEDSATTRRLDDPRPRLAAFGPAGLPLDMRVGPTAGRYDGFWERGLSAWDFAAGIVLIREAGGFVSEIEGQPVTADSPSLLACNAALGNSVRDLLTRT